MRGRVAHLSSLRRLAVVGVAWACGLVVSIAPAATEYQCGPDGKPNAVSKKCECASGKLEVTDAKGVSRCVDPPKTSASASSMPGPSSSVAKTAACPTGMASIPGGTYTLGETKKAATVAAFCMDVSEVTVKAYDGCVTAGKCTEPKRQKADDASFKLQTFCNWKHPSGRDSHPVNCVDWNQASGYCELFGKRLPTEEEWEWAARGGDKAWQYAWGNEAPSAKRLNACGPECAPLVKGASKPMYDGADGFAETAPVGSFPAGRWGLQDLSGNVWEWCSSKYSAGSQRVTRGGSFGSYDAVWVAAAARYGAEPSYVSPGTGFRCAK